MARVMVSERVLNVCKIGQNYDCCRYLLAGTKGFECAKFSKFRDLLDERVDKKQMYARGDNCVGIPVEESIKVLNIKKDND